MFNVKVSSLPKPKDQELQHIYNIIKQNNAVQADIGNKTPQMKNSNETQKTLQDFVDNCSKVEGSIKERLETFRCSADNCDTLLHAAVSCDAPIEFIQCILQHCPDLINTTRRGSYEGQNVLHIAIAKGDIELTNVILEASKSKEMLFAAFAKGSKFKKSILMGETPLSAAVTSLNRKMIGLLLEHGACIDQVNSKGDNVIHTLIKFAKLKREKIPEIIDMLKYFNETKFQIQYANETKDVNDSTITSVDRNDSVAKQQLENSNTSEDIIHRMWFKENRALMTPLKLATILGLHEIFQVMMKMENVFYFPGNFDGANYAHFYDITEIDHIAQSKCTKLRKEKADDFGLIFSIIVFFFPKRPICVIERSFFCLFFFKGFDQLSFFSVVFIEAVSSLFSFGCIISIAYATFTFAMFTVLEGQGHIDEFSDFGNTTLTMFSFMLGIKELTFLNEVDGINRVYVALIYVCFIFITYIYLINSLITLMSGSCGDVFEDRQSVAILQKSSVIIFLDGLFLKRRLPQENISCTHLRENRFYISIETEVANELKD
ncbi:transient receptor potential cation channel subfamily V member 6 [Biomphalaria glabrata]|nr:transient receptor potential cation channel subfamily V member 6-like; partial [Biomphalaria glabrata]